MSNRLTFSLASLILILGAGVRNRSSDGADPADPFDGQY